MGHRQWPIASSAYSRRFLDATTAVIATADVKTTSSSSAISTSHLCSSLYRVTAEYSFFVKFGFLSNSTFGQIRLHFDAMVDGTLLTLSVRLDDMTDCTPTVSALPMAMALYFLAIDGSLRWSKRIVLACFSVAQFLTCCAEYWHSKYKM